MAQTATIDNRAPYQPQESPRESGFRRNLAGARRFAENKIAQNRPIHYSKSWDAMPDNVKKRGLDFVRRQTTLARGLGNAKLDQSTVARRARQAAARAASKLFLRIVNSATGATIIGLIVTYAIMTVQLFAGNVMQSKIIPELDLWECIIWGILTFVVIILTILLLMMLILLIIIALGPVTSALYFGPQLVGYIF